MDLSEQFLTVLWRAKNTTGSESDVEVNHMDQFDRKRLHRDSYWSLYDCCRDLIKIFKTFDNFSHEFKDCIRFWLFLIGKGRQWKKYEFMIEGLLVTQFFKNRWKDGTICVCLSLYSTINSCPFRLFCCCALGAHSQ